MAKYDPLEPISRAAPDLGIEAVRSDGGLFVATEADADRVTGHAQELWDEMPSGFEARLARSVPRLAGQAIGAPEG